MTKRPPAASDFSRFLCHLRSYLFGYRGNLNFVLDILGLLPYQHVDIAAKLNICSSPRHVGGDGDGTRCTSLRNNKSFLLMVPRIQNLVRDARLFEQIEIISDFSMLTVPTRTGWPRFLAFHDQFGDGSVFLVCRAVNFVVLIIPDTRHIGWDFSDFQLVDFGEFTGFVIAVPVMPASFIVHAEIVLVCNRRQGLVFLLDVHLFFGLERLVQTFRIPPPVHHSAREFVNNYHFIVFDDVVRIPLKQFVGAKRLVYMMNERNI